MTCQAGVWRLVMSWCFGCVSQRRKAGEFWVEIQSQTTVSCMTCQSS